MMSKNPEVFWDWVQQRMEILDIQSVRELERRAGLSNGSIGARKNDLKFPTIEMAEGLCQALRISWCELWRHAGFVESLTSEDDAVLQELSEVVRQLSSNCRRDVLEYARWRFRQQQDR